MRRREVLLVAILIGFGLLYHFSEEEGVRFFGACSSDSRFLIDSDQAREFPQPPRQFNRIGRVDVGNPAGDVVVEPIEGDTLEVQSTIKIFHPDEKRAQKIYNRLKIEAETRSGELKLRVLSKDRFPYRRVRVVFRIGIPQTTILEIRSRYGDVHISGAGKEIGADVKYGDLRIERVASNLRIRHGYGRIQLLQIDGDVKMESAYSKLKVESARSLAALSKHTKMKLLNITDGVEIKNSHHSIEMRNCGGDIEINAHHCRVELREIAAGEMVIRNRHDDLTISDLEADQVDVSISNGNLRLHLNQVRDRINIGAQYSKIIFVYPDSISPLFNINVTYGKIKNSTMTDLDMWSGKYRELSSTESGEPEVIIANKYGDVILKNSNNLP